MKYSLTGEFLESCDCTVICPCWVDEDPVGGHCTGFVLWNIDGKSRLEDHDVSGCKVVSVATHSGNRRHHESTVSVLYVDPGPHDADADTLVEVLGQAFSGQASGILGELAEVTGTVTGPYRATITLDGGADDGKSWTVRVQEHLDHGDPVLRIEATGKPKVFDKEEVAARHEGQPASPMDLEHTALSYELQVQGRVVAQQGEHLTVRVGALPGGNLEAKGRSGMRGRFHYEEPPENRRSAPEPVAAAHG